MPVVVVPIDQAADITDVLCEAFHDYPVMRHVLGRAPAYEARLRTLVGFFVAARGARRDLMVGVPAAAGGLAAAALVNLPATPVEPGSLAARREAVWSALGTTERARYEAYGRATARFEIPDPHHHLGMIGVRRAAAGTGLARALLDHVHGVADADPGSAGVTLATELARNVGLYERFGYRLLGHARVADDLETWVMFRPADALPTDEPPAVHQQRPLR